MDNTPAAIPPNHQYIWNDRKNKYEVLDMNTGRLVPTLSDITNRYAPESVEYSPGAADKVIDAIRDGRSLAEIKDDPTFPPYNAIYAWKALNPDFKRRLDQAYKDRAEAYHDKAVAMGVQAAGMHKDAIPGMKLAVSTLQWAAERGDPNKYSGKVAEGGGKGGVTIIIDTGVQTEGTTNINIDVGDDGEFRGFINEQAQGTVRGSERVGPERGDSDGGTITLTSDRWRETTGDTTGVKTGRAVRGGNLDSEWDGNGEDPRESTFEFGGGSEDGEETQSTENQEDLIPPIPTMEF